MDNLEGSVIANIPESIYYLPEFITEEEEKELIRKVNDAPKPKWTQLLNRRLQNWGGLPHQKGMVPEKLPPWLDTYCKKISTLEVFGGKQANHVLVNEYLSGQGIMPHLDGSLYYPTVSTISLGSHTVLNFYHPLKEQEGCTLEAHQGDGVSTSSFDARHLTSILLEPRSLVLVRDDMYTTYLHGISDVETDVLSDSIANIEQTQSEIGDTLVRGTRISLTIRHVPKVLRAQLFLGKRW